MSSIPDNLKVFRKFLSARITIDDVHEHLKCYNDNYIEFEKDFYTVLINSNEDIRKGVVKLLSKLNVNKKLWGKYFNQNLTVSQFFKELEKDHEESIQLNELIDLIVKRRWHSQLTLLKSSVIAGCIIVPILACAAYPLLTTIVDFLIKTADILPILGILFSFGALCFNLYLNHLCDRRQKFKIYRDDAFLIASSAINILGKIALVAKTMFAPYAAFFFIAASLIDTLKELFFLLELRKKYLNKPDFAENNNTIVHQQYARYEYDYIKQRNALIINFISALSLTALVITCSFFPVGLVLTISTCASIAAVYLLKLLALTINEKLIASKLQTELKNIGDAYKQESVDESSEKLFIDSFLQSLQKDDDNQVTATKVVEETKQTQETKVKSHQPFNVSQSRYGFMNRTNSLVLKKGPDKEVTPRPQL